MGVCRDARQLKAVLLVIAVIIAFSSLYISNLLVRDLSIEERSKMEVWAEAMRTMNNADENMDLNLVLTVLNANNTIPVVVVDKYDNIQMYRNIKISSKDTLSYMTKQLDKLKRNGKIIRINYDANSEGQESVTDYADIYYTESTILKRLSLYPYIQLGVVLIFVIIAILALLSFKRAEQNMVWVGLSKETAHQLGTPISSLMAWLELLKDEHPDDKLIESMSEDVSRLQMVANRFSKIGSTPKLAQMDINAAIERITTYIEYRTSSKIEFQMTLPQTIIYARINEELFSWVVENIYKNAIDAMGGVGLITVNLIDSKYNMYIDITDTGKGIHKSKHNSVFTPGFTTKKRGWGLGLSLGRRIIEEYHGGRIYVKESVLGKGTTFRIELKK